MVVGFGGLYSHKYFTVGQSRSVYTVPSRLNLVFTSESVALRRKKVRGTLALKLIESAHIVSTSKVSLPERQWIHFPGSNLSDTLQGVVLPSLDDSSAVWKLSWKAKKSLYGKKHLILVGGKTPGEGDAYSAQIVRRQDEVHEPVCYHPFPSEVYDSLIHGFFAKLVIDLTPVTSTFAWAALCKQVAYVCTCYTPAHALLLEERLIELLKVNMAKPECPLFNPEYAKAVGAVKGDGKDDKGGKGGKPATAKGKAKGRAKGKAKAKKALKDDDEEGGSDGDLDQEDVEEEEADELWDPLQG